MYRVSVFLLVAFLVGCAASPQQQLVEQLSQTEQLLASQLLSDQLVAKSLMEQAEQFSFSGNLDAAVVFAERAKRYAPDNPYLWFQLARYYSTQQDYKQAESSALRTIRFSDADIQIKVKGWRLIEQARVLSGDKKNSHYAANRANELEKQQIFSDN